ncbi:Component of the polarisome [Pleurotus pulmonarius]
MSRRYTSLRSAAYQADKLTTVDSAPTTTEYAEERAILQLRHNELGETLAGSLALFVPGSRTKVRAPLERLTTQQLLELSGDVYDEVIRRKYNLVHALNLREGFHPKRNQTRQRWALLSSPKFQDLCGDVHFEISRRYPEFQHETMAIGQSSSRPTPGSQSHIVHPNTPNATLNRARNRGASESQVGSSTPNWYDRRLPRYESLSITPHPTGSISAPTGAREGRDFTASQQRAPLHSQSTNGNGPTNTTVSRSLPITPPMSTIERPGYSGKRGALVHAFLEGDLDAVLSMWEDHEGRIRHLEDQLARAESVGNYFQSNKAG